MKPTVTVLLEEFDRLRDLENDALKFKSLKTEIQANIKYHPVDDRTTIVSVRRNPGYINLPDEKLRDILTKLFL
jgi:hypothetical protein